MPGIAAKMARVDYARHLVRKARGLRTVYSCPFCKLTDVVPSGRGMGRGYGLASGGAAHSKMAAHIRAEHPAELERATELMAKPRRFNFASEPQRSDAMSDARRHTQDLIRATGGRWTFHHQRGVGDENDYYWVAEGR
jgi:hypothetical protein